VTLFYLVVAEICKSAVRGQCTSLDILVDESTDKRDAVFGVLLREELVGAVCNRS